MKEERNMTLEQARENNELFFKKNRYHLLDRCCAFCRFIRWEEEGAVYCTLAEKEDDEWWFGECAQNGLCDLFEKK